MVVLLALPAYAQRGGHGKRSAGSQPTSDEQKKKNAEREKNYKAALDRIPNKKPVGQYAMKDWLSQLSFRTPPSARSRASSTRYGGDPESSIGGTVSV